MDPAPPVLFVDCGRLKQVLTNLVGNGVKFTSRGGITLKASHDGETLRVSVEDTGIGIPEARQHAVFESFTQADASTSRKYGGTGLGLTICKNIITMMGGQIGLRSTLNAGSTFWFEIPAPACEESSTSISQALSDSQKGNLKGHVLVAEDNEINVMVVQKLLEQFGISSEVAPDGMEVVKMFGTGQYDLVLMDLHMPYLDGIEASREIRRVFPDSSKVPIIAMTAAALTEDRDACFEAGMNDYISKPFRAEEMRMLLAKYLPAV